MRGALRLVVVVAVVLVSFDVRPPAESGLNSYRCDLAEYTSAHVDLDLPQITAEQQVRGAPHNERSANSSYDGRSNLARASTHVDDYRSAPNTARALPGELTLGRNADVGVDVYQGVSGGKPVYAGITNDLGRRATQHGDRFEHPPVLRTPALRW